MTGKILVIAQQKGGSGKTTLAAHLAVAQLGAADGGRVAILDIDPQGSLGQWYERRERRLGEGETGLLLRTASGWGAKREARLLARDHDLVLIDMPPRSDMEARNAIEAADLVAVPVQPTPVDLWATEATLELVEKGGPPAILIVNRAPARSIAEATLAQLQKLAAPVAASQLGNRVAFGATMGSGSTVLEAFPQSKAADEVRALAAELQRRLASQPTKASR
ncbi:MAG TPA: ParA family partition ATPase [Kaistia sp.]|nr:ParA family partition ATPase [Kaistia sp.]